MILFLLSAGAAVMASILRLPELLTAMHTPSEAALIIIDFVGIVLTSGFYVSRCVCVCVCVCP